MTSLTLDVKSEVLGPTADSYKKYDQRTHVYMRPDMYIGSDEPYVRPEWIYNLATERMEYTNINLVPGCERLFLEILTNASDNVNRSRRSQVDPGKIEIIMDNFTVCVTNYGLPIPIEMHNESQVYVPQMIFGSLLTSSNYEVDRHEAGTNGIGAKATNIFSKEFAVIVCDAQRHKKYTQVWNNNMLFCSNPQIEEYTGKISSVQVIYKMDFNRFGYSPDTGYPGEAYSLFARHAIDISFTSKIPIIFNGKEYDMANIREYARLYFGDVVDTALVHYTWPENTEIVHKKKGYQISKNNTVLPLVELIALDTPDEGSHVSFVNSMMTRDGGVHVSAAFKAVGDSAVQMINNTVVKKLQRQMKEVDAKTKRAHTINIADVKPHISMLLSVRVVNPKFTSQTKTTLGAPAPTIKVPEDELKVISKWKLIERLYAALEAKQAIHMKKSDGKLKKYITTKRGVDANNAGKSGRDQCVLYITEGNSGSAYASKVVKNIPHGSDHIGILPMRGKGLNVMNADIMQIEANAEIAELKKMLGLVESTPEERQTYYLDDGNFSRLRYGSIMIMADSDVDGKHIIGLLLLYFYCRHPSLLARGYVMYYRTPTLRVTFNRQTLKFYTFSEYEQWRNRTANYKSWAHSYYKGLGTSSDAEIIEDLATPRVVKCFYDDKASDAMHLAFDKTRADARKLWINNWKPLLGFDNVEEQPISWFINHELILFSIEDVQRSIPKIFDGLKESQRKILYGMFSKWNINTKGDYKKMKVAQLGAYVAECSNYHHGELILTDVVVGMAQNFTGANNITYFTRDGQFGTRFKSGKDAAEPRYSFVRPEKIVAYIYRKEDRPILKPRLDEGQEIEPENYWPIIPMVLVNGCEGIGTGYSTYVPKHNPLDCVAWLKAKLQGSETLPQVLPWYRGFTGKIEVIDRRDKPKRHIYALPAEEQLNVDNDEIHEEEHPEEDTPDVNRPLLSMVSTGKFEINSHRDIVVTELPIGRNGFAYLKWLEKLVEEKKIKGFRSHTLDNDIHFSIEGFTEQANERNLKLQRSYGMSNMVLLNAEMKPQRFDTAQDILEYYYKVRLIKYEERKDHNLRALLEQIQILETRIRFIRAIISKQLVVVNRKKADIYPVMDQLQLPHELLNTVKMSNCTEDEVLALEDKILQKKADYQKLEETSPQNLWLSDLQEFEEQYHRMYST